MLSMVVDSPFLLIEDKISFEAEIIQLSDTQDI